MKVDVKMLFWKKQNFLIPAVILRNREAEWFSFFQSRHD